MARFLTGRLAVVVAIVFCSNVVASAAETALDR